MHYPRTAAQRRLAAFNWYVLFVCSLLFVVGGTVAGVAAFVLAHVPTTEAQVFALISVVLSAGFYAAAMCGMSEAEKFC